MLSDGDVVIEENRKSLKRLLFTQRATSCFCQEQCDCIPPDTCKMPWTRLKNCLSGFNKRREENDDDSSTSAGVSYDESRGWSFFNFGWMTTWIKKLAKGRLTPSQFPDQPLEDFDQLCVAEFGFYLRQYRDEKVKSIWDRWLGKIRTCILKVFRYSFVWLIIFTILRDMLDVSNAYLLTYIMGLKKITGNEEMVRYIFLCFFIWGTQVIEMHLDSHQHFYYKRVSIKAENMILSYLFGRIITKGEDYVKDLKDTLQPIVLDKDDNASVLNLALFDVYEIAWGVMKLVDFVSIPIRVVIVGAWLYTLVGFNAITALLLVFSLGVLMCFAEYKSARMARRYIKSMDHRIIKTQAVLEELQSYRLLKWIPQAYNSILESRNQEMRICQKRAYMAAIGHWVGLSLPSIVSLVLFVYSAISGGSFIKNLTLDASFAIPLLHTMTFFIKPLKELPRDINDHLETSVSCDRLETFLFTRNLEKHISTSFDRLSTRKVVVNPKNPRAELISVSQEKWTVCLRKRLVRHLPVWVFKLDKSRRKMRNICFRRPRTKRINTYTCEDSGHLPVVGMDAADWATLSSTAFGLKVDDDPMLVECVDASFTKDGAPVLNKINFTLVRNDVLIVEGPCNSGKSNLIQAILGEFVIWRGSVYNKPLQLDMPIGYVGQQPWIPVGTAQECIVFGHEMDNHLYARVIGAVELVDDIASWKEGDLKMIDEGGQCISTGQKARLALARVLYNQLYSCDSKCNLICLDDVFSVLDPALVIRIFFNLFGQDGLLQEVGVVVVMPHNLIELVATGNYRCNMGVLSLNSQSQVNPVPRQLVEFAPKDSINFASLLKLKNDKREYKHASTTAVKGKSSITFGNVKARNYIWFIRKVGLGILCLLVFVSLAAMFMDVALDMIVGDWSSIETSANECIDYVTNAGQKCYSAAARSRLNHLYVYTFAVSLALFLLLYKAFLETYCTIYSASQVYKSAIKGILNSTVDAFNKMTIGSINNRLFTDQSIVDYSVFYSLSSSGASICFGVIMTAALGYLCIWLLPMIPILGFIVYICVYRYYMPMCRENMRATLESRSELVTMVNYCISGSKDIRLTQRQGFVMSKFLNYLDIHQRTKFFANAAAGWTMLRLKLCLYPLVGINTMFPVFSYLYVLYTTGKVDASLGAQNALTASVGLAISYSYRFAKILKAILTRVVELESQMCASQRLQELAEMDPNYNTDDARIFRRCRLRKSSANVSSKLSTPKSQAGAKASLEANPKHQPICRTNIDGKGVNQYAVVYSSRASTSFAYPDCINNGNWPRIVCKMDSPPNASQNDESPRGLSIQNVSIAFESAAGDVQTILSGINLEIRDCDHVGLVGRTGAGKSSLLQVLSGLKEPSSGVVFLDGIDIGIAALQGKIASIPHVLPLLPNLTVRKIIDTDSKYSDDEIWAALELCTIASFVKSLSDVCPLDTSLEKPSRVAGEAAIITNMQLQYIILAKVLLNIERIRLVLVDEPRIIDSVQKEDEDKNDRRFNGSANAFGMEPLHVLFRRLFANVIVCIVAHDVASLAYVDYILAIKQGTIGQPINPKDVPNQVALANFSSC